MNRDLMARCFNEWMRRYIEEPARYAREFETIEEFKRQESGGETPSYGETSAAYMTLIANDLTANG